MCGICGTLTFDRRPVAAPDVTTMLDAMRYRGPDDSGVFVHGHVGLGAVRLSIIDLSPAGHMPMVSEDGRHVITYNGEVYNAPELRRELERHATFRSHSDTEVVLQAYRHWGPSCLDRFNGMFAFAIFDTVDHQLFCARDRFGIKPFYYYLDDRRFVFASEIPPILTQLPARPAPDEDTVRDFLLFNRTNQTERTFFSGIRKLQHGQTLTVDATGARVATWYTLRPGRPFTDAAELRRGLTDAIDLQLRSDVPVGACLSGGLDSATIVWLMPAAYRDQHLSTFSAVYGPGMPGDESPYIAVNGEGLARRHSTTPTAESLAADLDDFVRAQGEPTYTSSAYAEFKVMELAGRSVKVALSGQGVDEALGGYHYMFSFLFKQLVLEFHLGELARECWQYARRHRSAYAIAALPYLLLPASLQTQLRAARGATISRDFVRSGTARQAIPERLYSARSLREAAISHFEYKMEHHLMWGDRSSMWHSVEMRFPFLDHRIVEGLIGLDHRQVIADGMTKRLLREAVRGLVPEIVRTRARKVGFETPEDTWLRSEALRELVDDSLGSGAFAARGFADAAKVRRLVSEHRAGRLNAGKDIWKWLSLELWCRKFVDSSPAETFAVRARPPLAAARVG